MPAPRRCLLLLLATVLLCASRPGPASAARACAVRREFARLRELLPGLTGDCLAGARVGLRHRVVLQSTSRGLLVYRKKRRLAAFTNGSTTWLAGPHGLGSRPNAGPPFAWEVAKRRQSGLSAHPVRKRWARGNPLSWPVVGPVTTYFGEVGPYSPRGHQGIDISAPAGSSVRAAAAGRVVAVGWETGYGLRVVLEHGGGRSTMYAHLSTVQVDGGERVGAGQPIGRVGCTGWCTGPHLHFELRSGGILRDPLLQLP